MGTTASMRPALSEWPQFSESGCEYFGDGFWGQPVNATTSLAFLVVGAVILGAGRLRSRERTIYGILVAATGAGSLIAHGPGPWWAELAHDVPLMALIAFVAADAAGDLSGRRVSTTWWVVPALVVVAAAAAAGPPLRLAAQATLTAAAVGLSLLRFRRRPALRQSILTSLALLGIGALVGTLSRADQVFCDPHSVIQGHGIWHILAALAAWRLASVIGQRAGIDEGHPVRGAAATALKRGRGRRGEEPHR